MVLFLLLFCSLPFFPAGLACAPAPPSAAPAPMQEALPREVFGNVTDFAGKPVAGATVALADDRKTAVTTNSDGKFLMKSAVAEPRLRISSAGYYDTLLVVTATDKAQLVQLRTVDRYKRTLKKKYKAANKAWKN
ncbi:carboxypeptidase-like regulatory domain-containing protein [Hymenobacter sp. NST-14]|uniref:carboxypeptidase-like regulatory domain-containing protein n=1 Tax=Hymenobacter piscis TaxID=2839984 RepID=UPI001C00BB20|nr:carboxypeptidase-like regulatory domain-containing protein [Hymenobacter piscis]MBT9394504.1 carboxypeptidase-like regulatory domain-containing protein [Hymenobacter piscis]